MLREDPQWVGKYRPTNIDDVILPERLKTIFRQSVAEGDIPNLFLVGGSGIGKTTIARAVINELGCEYIVINGSLDGNIDTLRTTITDFASTMSMDGKRKMVIVDEGDYLNPQSTQPALRNFMETFSKNCGFIITGNYENRLIEPLRSRCTVINFDIQQDERSSIGTQFFKRACSILDEEGVTYEKDAVLKVIRNHFPDFRKALHTLQVIAKTGQIDMDVVGLDRDAEINELVRSMAAKKFTDVREWVGTNSDIDAATIYAKLYELCSKKMAPGDIASLVIILADYQHKHAFAVNKEINLAACCAMIMGECNFT